MHAESPVNPKHILLMPDSSLFPMPMETMPSLLRLLGKRSYGSMSRDLSLHLHAQRVRGFAEISPESAPLKAVLGAAKPSATTLLTDVFNEDSLRPHEQNLPKKAETLSMLHQRLVDAKVIGNAVQSSHGGMQSSSAEDIKGMLTDAAAFYSFGFGRFWTSIGSRHLASQNLSHLALLGLFHRICNDASFRRQTKTDSAKPLRQIAMENAYGTHLIAAFRGVLCTVSMQAPLATAVQMRNFETFTKAMQAGKTVSKAMEEVLCQSVESSALRYARLLEGGTAQALPADAPPGPEDLLLPQMKAAYSICGSPFVSAEEPAAAGKKK